MDVYLDESIKELGHSARMVWKSDESCISLGNTLGTVGHPTTKLVLISFNFGITLHGGPIHVDLFKTTKEKGEESDYVWQLLFDALTPEIFKEILRSSYKEGNAEGRLEIQTAFKELMNL